VLDKAQYSAFESTLNSPIVSYRISINLFMRQCLSKMFTHGFRMEIGLTTHSWTQGRADFYTKTTKTIGAYKQMSGFSASSRYRSCSTDLIKTVIKYQFEDAIKHVDDRHIDGVVLWSSTLIVFRSRTKQLVEKSRLCVIIRVIVYCCSC